MCSKRHKCPITQPELQMPYLIHSKKIVGPRPNSQLTCIHWQSSLIVLWKRSQKLIHTIASEGLEKDLYSVLRAFEQEGIFIVPWDIRSHLKDRPIQSPLTTWKGILRTFSNPDRHR
jgi:hypothetical protein